MRALALLAAYVFSWAALGALLNPPYNGPDEAGHVEYITTLVESGGRHITGVEARQPPTYYLVASVPWLATSGRSPQVRLFFVRLLSVFSAVVVFLATWLAARTVWPGRPWRALVAGALASLSPGFLYLAASASNDPLASAMASIALLGALRLAAPDHHTPRRWWWICGLTSLAAAATKLTTIPVILASAATLAICFRRQLWGRRWVCAITVLSACLVAATYVALLLRPATSSLAAAMAHRAPEALLRGPVAYVRLGGIVESTRTFWYAYDYAVRWPTALDAAIETAVVAMCTLAAAGAIGARPRLPLVLWLAVAAQVTSVIVRYGLGDALGNDMGGAAQAKAFFPAILPSSLLFVAGFAAIWQRRSAAGDAVLAASLFVCLLGLDAVSLALTVWHHFRWWRVGA